MKTNKTREDLLKEIEELKNQNNKLKSLYELNGLAVPDAEVNSYKGVYPSEQHMKEMLDNYIRMYATRDDLLTTYFSSNFSGFTGGGDFLVKDREQWVAITRQDFNQVKESLKIDLKDFSLQPLSNNIFVVTSFFNIHLPIKDHILSRETARLVLIFVRESPGWKIAHSSISIPYYLVREGEVYPMKELVDRNQYLEVLIDERTDQLSRLNEDLKSINKKLADEIDGHKKSEEELRKSNQKLEAIFSASPDGVGMVSLEGKIQLLSDKLIELYGYSVDQKEQFYDKSAFDFVDASNHPRLFENLQKLINGERNNTLSEYVAIRKDNSRFYIDMNATVLYDSQGKPEGILFVERDITERKKIELLIKQQNEQLHELNATKDKFFSIIAHDLRSPFQGFIGLTRMMADDITSFSLSELSELLKEMNSNANNLYKLLTNLLDWSRVQRGLLSFNPAEMNLSSTISQNLDLIIKGYKEKQLVITNDIDEQLVVRADEGMFNSILRNLLSNAVKFTQSGGIVNISAFRTNDNMVEISIADTGIGMSPDLCNKIFKLDEKVGRSGTDGEESTGLGLLLCKEFVEKQGGKIWVESKEDKGSTFHFTVPLP